MWSRQGDTFLRRSTHRDLKCSARLQMTDGRTDGRECFFCTKGGRRAGLLPFKKIIPFNVQRSISFDSVQRLSFKF